MEKAGDILLKIKGIVAVIGGYIASKLGGWDMLLEVLVGFIITDYILGVVASALNKEINSSIGFRGICKKVIMLIPIGLAYSMDNLMNTDMLRNTTIMFYLANEGISIIENLGKAGVPIPKALEKIFIQLQDENEEVSDNTLEE